MFILVYDTYVGVLRIVPCGHPNVEKRLLFTRTQKFLSVRNDVIIFCLGPISVKCLEVYREWPFWVEICCQDVYDQENIIVYDESFAHLVHPTIARRQSVLSGMETAPYRLGFNHLHWILHAYACGRDVVVWVAFISVLGPWGADCVDGGSPNRVENSVVERQRVRG